MRKQQIHLGEAYKTADDAARAVDYARICMYGAAAAVAKLHFGLDTYVDAAAGTWVYKNPQVDRALANAKVRRQGGGLVLRAVAVAI